MTGAQDESRRCSIASRLTNHSRQRLSGVACFGTTYVAPEPQYFCFPTTACASAGSDVRDEGFMLGLLLPLLLLCCCCCHTQGLADTFLLLGMPFDSSEAAQLNKEIFECIYFAGERVMCNRQLAVGLAAWLHEHASAAEQHLCMYAS